MKKLLTFLTLLTLFFGVSWATELIYVPTGNTEGTLTGAPNGVTVTTSNGTFTAGKGVGSSNVTFTLSGFNSSVAVTAVSLDVMTNNNYSQSHTITVKVGSDVICTDTFGRTSSTTVAETKTVNVTPTSLSDDLSINIKRTTNGGAFYISKVTVEYQIGTTPTSYNLTGNSENGSIVFTVGGATVTKAAAGATVTATATANPGYEFDSWTAPTNVNDWDEDGNTATFTMPQGNVTVGASFTEQSTSGGDTYKLVTKASELVSGAQYLITNADGTVLMGAMAGNDATFANQVKTGFTPNSSENTITLGSSCEATPITLGGSSGAWTLYNGSGFIAYTSNTTSNTGTNYLWLVDDASANGAVWNISIPTSSPYSSQTLIVNVYNNIRSIRYNSGSTRFAGYGTGQAAIALYKKVEPTVEKAFDVTVTQVTGGTIYADPEGENVVNAGDKITVTATPATGYELTGWTITGASETEPDANNQITATGNVTITATFSKVDYALTRSSNDLSMGDVKITDADGNILDPQPAAAQAGDVVYFKLTTNYGYQPTSNPVTVTNTTSSTTITVAGPDDDSGVYSFTMPAGNVNIAATFRPYQPTIRLAGRFNGRPDTYWETGNNGPAFNYDSETEKYTMDVFFTGAVENENEMIDYFWFRSDNEDLKTSASGDYWLTDGENGNIYQAEGHNLGIGNGYNSNFRIKPGIYTFTINKDRTKLFITKKDVAFTFTPATGTTVEQNSTVTATSDMQTILNGIKNTYDNGAVIGTITTQVSTDNSTWGESATMSVIGTNQPVYAKSTLDNLIVTDQATYTVEAVNNSNKYQLITSTADLEAGKKYIIVSETKSKAAGAFSSKYLIDADVTIANNIATVTDDVMVFTLGGDATNGWTFTSSEGLMGANSSNDINFNNNKATNVATISFGTQTLADESVHNEALITFGSNGHFIHNVNNARFKTYTSAYNVSMLPVQLYKQVDESAAPATATPVITPDSKDVKGGLLEGITITAGEEGTTPVIYYTTDGSDPGEASNANRVQYTEPFNIQVTQGGPQTVKAIAIENGKDPSNVVSVQYMFKNPDAPTFTPDPAVVQTGDFTITINSADGGVIYYVLDPDANEFPSNSEEAIATGQIYDNGVAVSGYDTHKIYAAVLLNGLKSSLSTATYTIIEVGAEGDWQLVTSVDQITDGYDYIIVNSDHDRAIKSGALETKRFYSVECKNNVVFGPNFATATVAGSDVRIFGFETEGDNIYMKDADNSRYYNFATDVSTSTSKQPVYITMADGFVYIKGAAEATSSLAYNTAYGNYFGIYATPTTTTGSQRPIYLYRRGPIMTLADICKYGVTTEGKNEYIIADKLQAVYAYTKGGNSLLWCKDLGTKSIVPTTIHSGQIDFMREPGINTDTEGVHNGQQGPWDQSNWIVLQFTNPTGSNNIDQMLQAAQDKFIKPGTIKGKLVDNENYILKVDLDQLDLVTQADPDYDEEPYNENVYCPANFLPENLNIHDGIENGDGAQSGNVNYFFMNPKVQEICYITYAQWDDYGYFAVPSSNDFSSGIDGAFQVGWVYQEKPALDPGKIYKFHAVVHRVGKEYGPQNPVSTKDDDTLPYYANITVLPIDLTADSEVVTAINTVDVTGKAVKSVKYVNVAGMVSDVPFQGVNIVVTEYTDGSRSTSKMLRK